VRLVWVVSLLGCRSYEPDPITERWTDNLTHITRDWHATGDGFAVEPTPADARTAYVLPQRALTSHTTSGVHLWLRKQLPVASDIRLGGFVVDPDVGLRVALYGDGSSAAPARYELSIDRVHGARLVVHPDGGPPITIAGTLPAWVKAERYERHRWHITHSSGVLRWFFDDNLLATYEEPQPLADATHRYLALVDGGAFDALAIAPL